MTINLLIVDDERHNVRSLERLLWDSDYEITSCLSGKSALEIISRESFDLVLMDVMMPDMDGHETCRRIRIQHPKLPVIMMTALLDDKSLTNSFKAGATDYIRKPINEKELICRINNTVRIKDAEQKLIEINQTLIDDLKMAGEVQSFLIPDWLKTSGNLLMTALYEPSQAVSGDLYDCIKVSETKSVVYIGDISGHGAQAALLMSAVQTVIKMITTSISSNELSADLILNHLNKTVAPDLFQQKYMTLLLGIADATDNSFKYCNAGHPSIIRINHALSEVMIIEAKSTIPLGWDFDMTFSKDDLNSIQLDSDCSYLIYTDGLYERFNDQDQMLGFKGIQTVTQDIAEKHDAEVIPYALKAACTSSGFSKCDDDTTILLMAVTEESHRADSRLFEVLPDLSRVKETALACESFIIEKKQDPVLAARIELIVTEQINNIIQHGIGITLQLRPKILVKIIIGESIEIITWDKGQPWSPLEQSICTDPTTNNALLCERGRGLMIISEFASSITHNHYAGLNETRIIVECNNGGSSYD